MKRSITLLCMFVVAGTADASESARVRLYCNSVQVLTGKGGAGGANTLKISTDSSFGVTNNELSPLFDPEVYFQLQGPSFPNPLQGQFALGTPDSVDTNNNGFDDFFEVSQPISGATSDGFYTTPSSSDTLTATWDRQAGSATGTVRVVVGSLGTFTHTFEIIEYTGTLTYQPGPSSITGSLALTQTQTPANTLSGSVSLVRVATNRFNQINLMAGSLIGPGGKALSYDTAEVDRDPSANTNYFGDLVFADGDPTTAFADYRQWTLSIDDLNDSNQNGIPDLSDDPPAGTTPTPVLELTKAGGQLLLTISAGQGKTYDLEGKNSLDNPTWSKVGSVTATGDPQTAPLAIPTTQTMFWRLRLP